MNFSHELEVHRYTFVLNKASPVEALVDVISTNKSFIFFACENTPVSFLAVY